jgi:hypothetical protein
MADTLFDALSGLNISGAENPYGVAAMSLGQVTPQLITPYTSTGRAVGIGLGSILLQSLLGYQARQEAARDTLEMNTLANQMIKMQTPEERTSFIGGVDDTLYQSRLSNLATALNQQEAARRVKAAEKLADLEAGADFELGAKGTELFKRKQQAELEKEIASATARRPAPVQKDWFQTIPAEQRAAIAGAGGSIASIRDLADQFRELNATGVGLAAKKLIPGSPEDLAMSKFETLVPGMAKMIGQLGNLNIYEQQALKEALEGRGYSGSQSIASRLDQLAGLAEKKIKETTETYKLAAEGGGEAVLQKLMGGGTTDISTSDKMQKLQQLQEMLAELKRQKAAAGK